MFSFNLFDIKNNKIVLNVESLVIPEFNKIWERDTLTGKPIAIEELSYIVFLNDYKSPYQVYPEEVRESKVKKDYIKNQNWEADDVVKDAIKKFKEFQYTPTIGLLDDAMFGINKLRLYYRNVDFSTTDAKGNFINKPSELTTSISHLSKMISSLESLKEKIEKDESINSSRVRGGGQVKSREE